MPRAAALRALSSRALAFLASWPQLAAGTITLGYNALVQRAYPAEFDDRSAIMAVAGVYLVAAVSFGVVVGVMLARRLQAAAANPVLSRDPGEPVLMFLLFRALSSTICWLMSIPVFGLVAIQTYGRVHPVGFPHFCVSIVVGWLVSTTYSTLLCINRMAQAESTGTPGARPVLIAAARFLPVTALGVPLSAAAVFLFFAAPGPHPAPASRLLLYMLVGLMTLGGYGFVYCVRLTDRLRLPLR
jgi:hypothetical protein